MGNMERVKTWILIFACCRGNWETLVIHHSMSQIGINTASFEGFSKYFSRFLIPNTRHLLDWIVNSIQSKKKVVCMYNCYWILIREDFWRNFILLIYFFGLAWTRMLVCLRMISASGSRVLYLGKIVCSNMFVIVNIFAGSVWYGALWFHFCYLVYSFYEPWRAPDRCFQFWR